MTNETKIANSANTDGGEQICHCCHELKPHCKQVVVWQDCDYETTDWVCEDCLADNVHPCADCGKLILNGEGLLGHNTDPQPVYGEVCYLMPDGERVSERAVVDYTHDQTEHSICCKCLDTNYQPCGDCGDMWRKDELVDAVIDGKLVKVCPHCARDMIICDHCGRPCDKVDDSGEDWLCALCASVNAETTK